MRDLKLITNDEPAERLFTQGMVIKNGAKMSKSKGNVVSPDDMVARYGADATRMYALFAAPPDRDLDWQEDGVAGISRFLSRVYRAGDEVCGECARCCAGSKAAGSRNSRGTGTVAQTASDDSQRSRRISRDAGTSIPALPRSWNWSTTLRRRMRRWSKGEVAPEVLSEILQIADFVAGSVCSVSSAELWQEIGGEGSSCARPGRSSTRLWRRKMKSRFRCR